MSKEQPPSWPWILAIFLVASGIGVCLGILILAMSGHNPFMGWF